MTTSATCTRARRRRAVDRPGRRRWWRLAVRRPLLLWLRRAGGLQPNRRIPSRNTKKGGVPQGELQIVGEAPGPSVIRHHHHLPGRSGDIPVPYGSRIRLWRAVRKIAYLNKMLEITLLDEPRIPNTFSLRAAWPLAAPQPGPGSTAAPLSDLHLQDSQRRLDLKQPCSVTDGFSESVSAFANCVNTPDGGTHLTELRTALTRVLNSWPRRRLPQGRRSQPFRRNPTLTRSLSVRLNNWRRQDKAKLGNPEMKMTSESTINEGLGRSL